jgi:hypothetical protein
LYTVVGANPPMTTNLMACSRARVFLQAARRVVRACLQNAGAGTLVA